MVETEFDGIPAFRIDTDNYDTAAMYCKTYYGKGWRYFILDGDDLFIVFNLPEGVDRRITFEFEDSCSQMLCTLQHLKEWR